MTSSPAPSRDVGGFTFLEVMMALAIVGIALLYLQAVSSRTLEVGADASALRRARALCRAKLEELALDLETASRGQFEDLPGYEWEADEQVVEEELENGQVIRLREITCCVDYPTLTPTEDDADFGLDEEGDRPGRVCLTTRVPEEREETR